MKVLPGFLVKIDGSQVMGVVADRAGGRRGKELVSPMEMDGAYAAIRRVQEARRKEALQVRWHITACSVFARVETQNLLHDVSYVLPSDDSQLVGRKTQPRDCLWRPLTRFVAETSEVVSKT